MFDLHLHTNNSDGSLSTIELIEKLEYNNIQVFSITDHNNCKAYKNLEHDRLIRGVELTTSYQGTIIEVLGYDVDPGVINTWFDAYYSQSLIEAREHDLFNTLKTISENNGFKLAADLQMPSLVKGISKKTVYQHLADNFPQFPYKSYKSFFREGLSNPDTPWFLNEARTYPALSEVITLIHDAQGTAFLAHPHEYGLTDLHALFNHCIELGIDGLECFHPSASMYQSVAISKFCVDHKLLGSGGSDFHRESKGVPLGIHAQKELLEFECFNWIKERYHGI